MVSIQLIVICATLAVASAGDALLHHGGYAAVAPIAKVAHYSPATSVSHTYSSIAEPAHLTYGHGHVAYAAPTIGSAHESTVRSFGGTVAHQSKAIDTPFSSVRKADTRISNNVYTPALAHTVYASHAAPAVYSTHHAVAPAVYATHHHAAAPAVYATHHAAAPAVYAAHHHHGAPAVYAAHASPIVAHAAGPVLATAHAAPVAHVSFNGLGVQYGW